MTQVHAYRRRKGHLQLCRVLSRVLIFLSVLVLLLSPLTECLLTLDTFPRHGQDFELSLFLILAYLCLVLLAAFWAKRAFDQGFGKRTWEAREFPETEFALLHCYVRGLTVWVPPKLALSLGVFAAPLRI